ncbi:MAG: hypothetical protein NZ908_03250, partial [Candidatus Micrarchaeota archaeon]|nr:hypothetical protein [Candidatus Micrarchaeota archaeon]
MGSTNAILKVALIVAILVLSGCLQSSNSVVLRDVCCQTISNSQCVELRNSSNLNQNLQNIISINSGGECSDVSRVCYNMNITYSGVRG